LGAAQLAAPQPISQAYGVVAHAAVGVLVGLNQQIATQEEALGEGFNRHPDAKTIRSLPGLGMVLGARVLGEFGDDQTRFPTAKSPKNDAGSAPITKASGRSLVVLARQPRNRRLADALDQWAFCSLTQSPGARR
jgi:transposase